jgi:hypothetical protein
MVFFFFVAFEPAYPAGLSLHHPMVSKICRELTPVSPQLLTNDQ